jgi:hypothetical protein
MNVNSTFLNGILEEVFIEQHLEYKVNEQEDKVLKLNKALCGLKQALYHGIVNLITTPKQTISRIAHTNMNMPCISRKKWRYLDRVHICE